MLGRLPRVLLCALDPSTGLTIGSFFIGTPCKLALFCICIIGLIQETFINGYFSTIAMCFSQSGFARRLVKKLPKQFMDSVDLVPITIILGLDQRCLLYIVHAEHQK
jgi:hypothetical protein